MIVKLLPMLRILAWMADSKSLAMVEAPSLVVTSLAFTEDVAGMVIVYEIFTDAASWRWLRLDTLTVT